MSQETMESLNRNTLVGFVKQRMGLPWFRADGKAWHYDESKQGDESNHFDGAIPPEVVIARLFNFEVNEAKAAFMIPCDFDDKRMTGVDEDGLPYRLVVSKAGRKGMLRSDNDFDLGVFKGGYQGHPYEEWLIGITSNIIDDSEFGLGIGSAGLLREGAQAWVSIELPETQKASGDIEFRSQLTGWTSYDGSLSTGWGRHFQIIVCDNTREIAHGEAARSGQIYKVRHSKHSKMKLNDARQALNVVQTMDADFSAEIDYLLNWKITDADFEKLLDTTVPKVEVVEGKKGTKRGATMREKKREEIITLYRADERCQPRGTAWAATQAFNTWNHHFAKVRGDKPVIVRNKERAIYGETIKEDVKVLASLAEITGHDLVAA